MVLKYWRHRKVGSIHEVRLRTRSELEQKGVEELHPERMEKASEHRGAAFVEEKDIIGGIVLRLKNWAQVTKGTYRLMMTMRKKL